jgi:DNA-binding NtrC family response regulator
MALPRILIIDDIFGSSLMDRKNLCRNFGLVDVTGDDENISEISEPVGEVLFCSGQIRNGNTVRNDINVAIDAVQKGWDESSENRLALILLDIRFVSGQIGEDGEPEGLSGDDSFGLDILDAIHQKFYDIPVIIVSSKERAEIIEDCRRRGASDFIQRHEHGTRTLSPREILKSKIFEHGLIEDNRDLLDERYRIVGKSTSLLKTLRSARRAATGKGNILILGETGTGKELLARYIHDISIKAEGRYKIFYPFGTAETLQEDELFGHVRGAFTGANSDREGLFEIANAGTLFIDEIGDIPESIQLKLLRPLENRIVTRQGESDEIPIDVQVVLATNKNLDEYSKTGKFKYDLLNRINAYTITIPPLKERKEDIPLIAERFIKFLCKEHNARWPKKILPETTDLLINHEWCDNVRGLRNVLERAIKDNSDSELLVPTDIRFDTYEEPSKVQTVKTAPESSNDRIGAVIDYIADIKFPKDYSILKGKLPELQEAVAKMLASYLESSIEVTKKMKPNGSPEGELNLTGAASCMVGKQLKTPKAADIIKKLLQQDTTTLETITKEHPILDTAYKESLRLRPRKPKRNQRNANTASLE